MADERIDIYDEHNQALGRTAMKSEAHAKGLWHRAAHIWMYTPKGELLLQLRSREKELYPNCWDISVAGHVSAGESPEDAALREIQEEVGIIAQAQDLELIRIFPVEDDYKQIQNKEFYYFFLYPLHASTESLVLQKEEVADTHLIHVDDLEKDLRENPDMYVTHGSYWNEAIEAVRQRTTL